MLAVVKAVADAPPPMFSGGGYWEAMHDEMSGYYEVRVDYDRNHYRLFCVLERNGAQVGLDGPSLVLVTGMVKAFRTVFSDDDYRRVRALGDEYRARVPRSVLPCPAEAVASSCMRLGRRAREVAGTSCSS
jgi:hypothetical protein